MRKKLIVLSAIAAVTATTLGGVGIVSAHSQLNGSSDLVDKIATTFKLDKNEVQKVFDEDRQAHQAEREQAMKDRLSQAVSDGTLTQEQADKITAKQTEMRAFRDTLKDKTDDERKAAMDSKREELKQWAKDNGISDEAARFLGPAGGHGPRGEGHMMKGGM